MVSRFDIALEPLLPASGPSPAEAARRLLRLARVGLHLVHGMAIAALVFPFARPARKRERIRDWSRGLLKILAVRLTVSGMRAGPQGVPLMLVANHVSWLDVHAINAALPVRFVAKSEVRGWPVIGWLAVKTGTLFIRRERRGDTVRVNERLGQAMRGGDPVAVFPEGTTTDGAGVLEFHSSLLQPAVQAGAVLQPVAIRYLRPDGSRCEEAAYYGSDLLWLSLKRVAAQAEIRAELAFLSPLESGGRCRRELARETRGVILRTLCLSAPDSPAGTRGGLPAAAR